MVLVIQIALGIVLGVLLLAALPAILGSVLVFIHRCWRGLSALLIGTAFWLTAWFNLAVRLTPPMDGANIVSLAGGIFWGLVAWGVMRWLRPIQR